MTIFPFYPKNVFTLSIRLNDGCKIRYLQVTIICIIGTMDRYYSQHSNYVIDYYFILILRHLLFGGFDTSNKENKEKIRK